MENVWDPFSVQFLTYEQLVLSTSTITLVVENTSEVQLANVLECKFSVLKQDLIEVAEFRIKVPLRIAALDATSFLAGGVTCQLLK